MLARDHLPPPASTPSPTLPTDSHHRYPIVHIDHTRNAERFWRLGIEILSIAAAHASAHTASNSAHTSSVGFFFGSPESPANASRHNGPLPQTAGSYGLQHAGGAALFGNISFRDAEVLRDADRLLGSTPALLAPVGKKASSIRRVLMRAAIQVRWGRCR